MIISEGDLYNNLVDSFAYHDAKILKLEENSNDLTMLFTDGWNEGQMNQITFTNCRITYQYDFVGSVIYQLDDVHKSGKFWHISFLVWVDGNLLEKVVVEAENIISRKYQLKENISDAIKKEDNLVFEELKQLINQMGISVKNLEKIKSEEYKSAESKILSSRKKVEMIEDINNYDLVSEEDLNKEIYGK